MNRQELYSIAEDAVEAAERGDREAIVGLIGKYNKEKIETEYGREVDNCVQSCLFSTDRGWGEEFRAQCIADAKERLKSLKESQGMDVVMTGIRRRRRTRQKEAILRASHNRNFNPNSPSYRW